MRCIAVYMQSGGSTRVKVGRRRPNGYRTVRIVVVDFVELEPPDVVTGCSLVVETLSVGFPRLSVEGMRFVDHVSASSIIYNVYCELGTTILSHFFLQSYRVFALGFVLPYPILNRMEGSPLLIPPHSTGGALQKLKSLWKGT